MFTLIIKHKGKILEEIKLQTDTVYTAGRSQDNHIVLSEQVGISRKHLEFLLQGNEKLTVKNLSPLHTLVVDGTDQEDAELESGQSFQVQSYEFLFKKAKETNMEKTPNPPPAQKEHPSEEMIKQDAENLSPAHHLIPQAHKEELNISTGRKDNRYTH